MESRSIAQVLVAGTVGLAALIGSASIAGAATTTSDPGCVIVTFADAGPQTPTVVTPVSCPADPDTNAAVYAQMQAAANTAKAGCGIFQVDLAHLEGPWATATVGVVFPPNSPGALSAITGIVGTGVCNTPPSTTTPPVTAPPATTTPPPAQTVTDAPPVSTTVSGDAVATTSISLRRTFAVAQMPNTGGGRTADYAIFGGSLIAAGGLMLGLTRRTQKTS